MELVARSPTNNLHAIHLLEQSVPQVKKRYNLSWTIGRGQYGSVLLGKLKCSKTSMCYAIKLIGSKSERKDIEDELKYLKRLKGAKNIVQYVKHYNHGSCTAIVTEYFKGESFKFVYRKFTPTDVQLYMKNLLIALQQVHALGITHGDVKPGNFLFNKRTRKYLLVDFGMAQPVGTQLIDMGTVGYIAPESVMEYEKSSSVIDIWSAGIIFLILLSGLCPFFHESGNEALKEFSVVFGTEAVRQVSTRLEKFEFFRKAMMRFKRRHPLDLRKICVLFRQHKKLHSLTNWSEKCPFCEQLSLYCVCASNNFGQYDVLRSTPDGFPLSAYDLLEKMLTLDPFERITAKEALRHRFFKEHLSSKLRHCEEADERNHSNFLRILVKKV